MPVVTAHVDGVTVFGLGLIIGGLGLLALAAVGLGHLFRLLDGPARRRPPRRAPAGPRRTPPRAGRTVVNPRPFNAPTLNVRMVNARQQSDRSRQANQSRRSAPTIVPSALLAETVLLQRVPAWSEPAPDQHVAPSPPAKG